MVATKSMVTYIYLGVTYIEPTCNSQLLPLHYALKIGLTLHSAYIIPTYENS